MHVKRNVDNLMAESDMPVCITSINEAWPNQAVLSLTMVCNLVHRDRQTNPGLLPRR
jgi:hypothetical protein